MKISFKSTSKINFFLNIIGKDPIDNYHFIESIFFEIPWGDDFTLQKSDKDSVNFVNKDSIPEKNTISDALFLFKQKYNIQDCFAIDITKNVPMGAGLGGGSGNAGALLKTLAKLYNIPPIDCLDIASRIGSDVPFFLYGGSALVEGKGEKITPLAGKPDKNIRIVIIYPNTSISTAKAFTSISKTAPLKDLKKNINFFTKKSIWDIDNLKKMSYNIFDDELDVIAPHLKIIKNDLKQKLSPYHIVMTGSGSSFILLFDKTVSAEELSLFQKQNYSIHCM